MPERTHPTRDRRVRAIASIVALGGIAAAAGCSSSSSPSASGTPAAGSTSSSSGGTITTAWPTDITTLDPANLSTDQDHELSRNLYQTLALPAFKPASGGQLNGVGENVVPYLAKSWDIGKTSITYHLRTNVTFNGTGDPLTADDVKFSLDRIFSTPGAGDLESNGVSSPKNITVLDPHTVKISFTSTTGAPLDVTPTLQAIFAQHFTGVIDEKAVLPHETKADPTAGDWLRNNVAGSGPYVIASRTPGQSIVLKASPTSWMPVPDYSTVDIQVTTGSIASLLQSHEINFGEFGMTNQQINSLKSAGLTADWADTGFFDMFAITSAPASQVGALANPLVRQAVAYALPYNEVLTNILYGRGSDDHSIVMPSAPEYTPAWKMYTTDLDKAKALLQQAGNPKIDVPLHYLQGDVDQTNIAELIQANLKKIGITTTLTPETQAGLFDVLDARSSPAKGAKIGPPGMELFNWSGFSDDPSVVIGYWATKGGINNYTLWSSPVVDAIDKKYASANTSPAKTAAWQKAQDIIAQTAPLTPIASVGTVTVVDPSIEGVSFSAGGSGRFYTLYPSGQTSALDTMLFG